MNKPLPSSRYVIIGQPGEEHFDPWSYSLMHRAAPATEIAMSRYTGDIAECAWADWLYMRAGAGDDLTLDAGATCC